MTALLVSLIGGTIGLGLFVLIRAFTRSAQVPLADLRAGSSAFRPRLATAAGADPGRAPQAEAGIRGLLGRFGVTIMEALRVGDPVRLNDQLRVLDRTIEQHAYEKMLGSLAGFVLPILLGVVLAAGGVGVPALFILLISLVGGAGGFFYPDLPLAERVEERRRTFRHALSSYLDLVTILLAGGAGTESALEGAAEDGDGWPFAELRNALNRAALTRTSPWEAFEELGIELGVPELQELAASVALAGAQGARIKQSLTAKADALRAAQAADLEAAAERQTEKMLVPLMVMAFGLTLFIGYGAIQSITTNDSGRTTSVTTTEVTP